GLIKAYDQMLYNVGQNTSLSPEQKTQEVHKLQEWLGKQIGQSEALAQTRAREGVLLAGDYTYGTERLTKAAQDARTEAELEYLQDNNPLKQQTSHIQQVLS